MWISDFYIIKEINEDGYIIMKFDVDFGIYGRYIICCGNLLFLKDYSVYILMLNGEICNFYINVCEYFCIYVFKIISDIFVVVLNWVIRYSEKGKKLEKI